VTTVPHGETYRPRPIRRVHAERRGRPGRDPGAAFIVRVT